MISFPSIKSQKILWSSPKLPAVGSNWQSLLYSKPSHIFVTPDLKKTLSFPLFRILKNIVFSGVPESNLAAINGKSLFALKNEGPIQSLLKLLWFLDQSLNNQVKENISSCIYNSDHFPRVILKTAKTSRITQQHIATNLSHPCANTAVCFLNLQISSRFAAFFKVLFLLCNMKILTEERLIPSKH